jgi:hypothetical protein
MITLSPKELLAWQIYYYEKRLADARTPEERSFLRQELFRLKRKKDD